MFSKFRKLDADPNSNSECYYPLLELSDTTATLISKFKFSKIPETCDGACLCLQAGQLAVMMFFVVAACVMIISLVMLNLNNETKGGVHFSGQPQTNSSGFMILLLWPMLGLISDLLYFTTSRFSLILLLFLGLVILCNFVFYFIYVMLHAKPRKWKNSINLISPNSIHRNGNQQYFGSSLFRQHHTTVSSTRVVSEVVGDFSMLGGDSNDNLAVQQTLSEVSKLSKLYQIF